jgi:hypothetical protein
MNDDIKGPERDQMEPNPLRQQAESPNGSPPAPIDEQAVVPEEPVGQVLNPVDFGPADPLELQRTDTARLYERTLIPQDATWWHHFTRNALAVGLALLLAILTITITAAAIAGTDAEILSLVGQLTITPVVALCGTAFGFYFAQQAAARDDH